MTEQKNTDLNQRHSERMARKKSVVDAKIDAAKVERGLLLVNTGNGKGKSTAAFGLLARALGHGMKAVVVQFVKGRSDTGEEAFFRDQPGVTWHVMGEGFTWETQNRDRDISAAQQGWAAAQAALKDPAVGVVILDELNIVLKYKYLELSQVLADITQRPSMQHVIVTGRAAQPELVELADTVTDMTMVKHAFKNGVQAMPGVEW
ncbi:cob(I)yrinic acid a,c-diamide adenosyltransferase [Methylobacillus gramineus]|uniref:cob(I)yrinic acid a,c-diamide adenosyltransferase n=1 Tax=Methylobacillus gramineus TaxID=755169 RepID=UPI001CFF7D0D|nr:cob(I)yrinic acid a,c-diamide adenosyltransferase [Methylobacillus gramineus]MCB5185510.1 cob(I)yrinic acid a,c-diamide adenosyltransferase [Methylobacillus gramineus]